MADTLGTLTFAVLLVVIGARYLTFQTLYGLRTYWLCGLALIAAGVVAGVTVAPVYVGAFAGAAVELVVAVALASHERSASGGRPVR